MVDIDMNFEEAIAEVQKNGAKQTAAEWLGRIEAEYGTSPLIYQKLEACPEALISHLLYKNAVTQAGALPPKTVELISLAVGAALRCDHCTTYHMQVAKKMGITNEEILEAVLVAGLLANSSVLANAYRLVVPEKEPCVGTCAMK
ncbi:MULTISPECIES: carboxymuconolactone decarboxylase family protein [Methanocorpusculum]|jgi:AhpD family alkylhydroperoxidase|uniref:Alkylhydroperoxidase n=1 Tax=Methanocorpusculum parvum TaxID=2193 RepID=A0AAX0Q870_9EURY|nr:MULTISPECIES: carboxymuconolactone decarboxylase family protein [Methanocorpusculum]PAV09441.1 alkylhydroperoxidase [Methanocorpusculum parvum]